MYRTRHTLVNKKQLALLSLFAALAVSGTASAAGAAGLPPQLGKVCGSVKGAAWKLSGQTGTHYSVIAKTAAIARPKAAP